MVPISGIRMRPSGPSGRGRIKPTPVSAPAVRPQPAVQGVAQFVPINAVVQALQSRSGDAAAQAEYGTGLLVVDTNLDFQLTPAVADTIQTADHHGRHGKVSQADGTAQYPKINATMKTQARIRAALDRAQGDVQAAVADLGITRWTTDNIADAAEAGFIVENQVRALTRPQEQALLRAATQFIDYRVFGSDYTRDEPGVVLGAALLYEYGVILGEHHIVGSDRLPQDRRDVEIMRAAVDTVKQMLDSEGDRRSSAAKFWAEVDAAREVAAYANIETLHVGGKVALRIFDMNQLRDYAYFVQCACLPLVDTDMPLHVDYWPIAMKGDSAPRYTLIAAIPDGRSLPTGSNMIAATHTIRDMEKTRADQRGSVATPWFGRDTVMLNIPGSQFNPHELAAFLVDPTQGLF
jgi:hypothetical protein